MSEESNKPYYGLMMLIGILLLIASGLGIGTLGGIIGFTLFIGFVLICYGAIKFGSEF
ncbi:MAG: hypothetical protein ACFE9N_16820 [Promethearchaeota archaeon]